jgi:hypothetical protein
MKAGGLQFRNSASRLLGISDHPHRNQHFSHPVIDAALSLSPSWLAAIRIALPSLARLRGSKHNGGGLHVSSRGFPDQFLVLAKHADRSGGGSASLARGRIFEVSHADLCFIASSISEVKP